MYKYTVEMKNFYQLITIYADRERMDDGWLYFEIADNTPTGTKYRIIAAYDLCNVRIWNNETLMEKMKEQYGN